MASAAAMSVRLVSLIDRLQSFFSAICMIKRAGRFGSTAMFLPLRSQTDLIDRSAAQPSPPVERSIVPMILPLVLLGPAQALILADRAQVAVDVATLHGGDAVGHVVVQDLLDGDALVLEVAQLVGEMDRAEADPHRVHAGDLVGLADGGPCRARGHSREQCRCEQQQASRPGRGVDVIGMRCCPILVASGRFRVCPGGGPSNALVEDVAQEVEQDLGREDRGNPRRIVGRRHLDEIDAHDLAAPGNALQELHDFHRGSRHGWACPFRARSRGRTPSMSIVT